ncbi:MAG: DUF512 domain-containing protein [Candidatus Latescibacteria bacterium]|nr:DUF512 domain-containing protein [Candidatus Latescibacterota bacterium]
MRIQSVEPESLAEQAGLRSGDRLMKINGARVRDSLDYQYWSCDSDLALDVLRADGKREQVHIDKAPDEDLGLNLIEPPYQACANKCIFCFIHQLPKGLRKSLYFQDEDVRLSFLFGNYVTLAFASDAYIERIIVQRLSPIYVSVHTTDPALRRMMLGTEKAKDILPIIQRLAEGGILIETQVVLCPEINDGPALRRTVDDLARFFPAVESISIVPVGLTDHRQGLHPLNPVTPEYARRMIDIVEGWQAELRAQLGKALVYLSDEWYLMSGTPLPPPEAYDEFPQIENGVGMVRRFMEEMGRQTRRLPRSLPERRRITLVTGVLAQDLIRDALVAPLNRVANLDAQLVVVENDFFGHGITVSGLLVGRDIVRALQERDVGSTVYLPPNCVNDDGLFLDGMTLDTISTAVGAPVSLFPERVREALNTVTSDEENHSE